MKVHYQRQRSSLSSWLNTEKMVKDAPHYETFFVKWRKMKMKITQLHNPCSPPLRSEAIAKPCTVSCPGSQPVYTFITLFSLGSLMISVPLIVGILLTCLSADMVIPEVWITDKPASFCSCPAPAKMTASCLAKSSHAENQTFAWQNKQWYWV